VTNPIFACMRPYADVEVKKSRRRLRCRVCGKTIAKGEEYAVLEYFDGPYIRRKAVCLGCAREWIADNILCEAWRQYKDAIRECIESRARRSLVMQILQHYGVFFKDDERKKVEEECRRMGFVVELPVGLAERARMLGLDYEKIVMEKYPRARVIVVK